MMPPASISAKIYDVHKTAEILNSKHISHYNHNFQSCVIVIPLHPQFPLQSAPLKHIHDFLSDNAQH